jgi:hypothetical protein
LGAGGKVQWSTPKKVAANNALCILCVATNTCTVDITGFTGP